jgi:hypothetical protein
MRVVDEFIAIRIRKRKKDRVCYRQQVSPRRPVSFRGATVEAPEFFREPFQASSLIDDFTLVSLDRRLKCLPLNRDQLPVVASDHIFTKIKLNLAAEPLTSIVSEPDQATMAVTRKLVAYMLAVDRRKQDFVPAEELATKAVA